MNAMDLLIELLMRLICAGIVVCVHVYPKMIIYKYLVHPLYRKQTQISMNPLKYMDPFGMISFVFLGAGWQKPFNFNTGRLRDKNRGLLSITLIGLLANLLMMTLLIPVFTGTLGINDNLSTFIYLLILSNLAIVIVNLLPVPPLDMVKIIQSVNPSVYFKFVQYEKMIQALFIFALATGFVSNLVGIVFKAIMSPIVGG